MLSQSGKREEFILPPINGVECRLIGAFLTLMLCVINFQVNYLIYEVSQSIRRVVFIGCFKQRVFFFTNVLNTIGIF